MTIDTSRYAANPFYCHVQRFRDEWLEPHARSLVRIRDMHLAYDTFCTKNNIRHRRVPDLDLLCELSRIGVRLGNEPPSDGPRVLIVFKGWRLTRNARYAIRDLKRPAIDERRYPPILHNTVDVRAYERLRR
jgi:hypothetical protein